MKRPILISFCILSFVFSNCSDKKEEKKTIRFNLPKKTEFKEEKRNSALPLKVSDPLDNPTTPEKVALGKLLFYDPILSGNKDVACATCHHPDNGYAEFRDISIGVNGTGFGSKRVFNEPNTIPFVKRNAHTVLNTAFNGIDMNGHFVPEESPMFWDIRALSLENQALEPIKAMEEMRGQDFTETEILDEVVIRLKNIPEYRVLFRAAFDGQETITAINIGKAIAAFERTLTANNSRFDQYMRGDKNAISVSEKNGYALFKKVGCINCHSGAMFSDYEMHVLGVPENEKLPIPDSGFEEQFSFRTASLRNLRFTAPYMHNGSLNTLQKVLEFYEDISFAKSRNASVASEQFDPLVKEINLSVKEMGPIISFLNTLNDPDFDKEIPGAVPSGLFVGGNIKM